MPHSKVPKPRRQERRKDQPRDQAQRVEVRVPQTLAEQARFVGVNMSAVAAEAIAADTEQRLRPINSQAALRALQIEALQVEFTPEVIVEKFRELWNAKTYKRVGGNEYEQVPDYATQAVALKELLNRLQGLPTQPAPEPDERPTDIRAIADKFKNPAFRAAMQEVIEALAQEEPSNE